MSSSIYFLLPSGDASRLHRIPMAETWHFYLGEPITVCPDHSSDVERLKYSALTCHFYGHFKIQRASKGGFVIDYSTFAFKVIYFSLLFCCFVFAIR